MSELNDEIDRQYENAGIKPEFNPIAFDALWERFASLREKHAETLKVAEAVEEMKMTMEHFQKESIVNKEANKLLKLEIFEIKHRNYFTNRVVIAARSVRELFFGRKKKPKTNQEFFMDRVRKEMGKK